MNKILVVDDSPLIRQQLRTVLEPAGYQVLEADDGTVGLREASAARPDLLIVDLNMPTMNGLQMIGALRKEPAHARTPIFVLTTESSPERVAQGKALGVTAWVVKPFRAEALLRGVQRVLTPR